MPRLTQTMELYGDEYRSLPRKPIYLFLPPTDKPINIKLMVAKEIGESGLPRMGRPPKLNGAARTGNGKAEFECPKCHRTDFKSQRALTAHQSYESGRRKLAGIAAPGRRGKAYRKRKAAR